MTLRRLTNIVCISGALLSSVPAMALDFRSVAETGTLLFAAPSETAQRLFVVSRAYPVEVVDEARGWSRVRDASGQLAWVQSAKLTARRHVLVTAARAAVRQAPKDNAAVLLQAERNVVLELLEPPTSLWVKVRHDGKTIGFVHVQDIWGI